MRVNKSSPKWVIYSSMGLELGLSVVVGFLIGSGLDKWLETEPFLLIIFGIAGIWLDLKNFKKDLQEKCKAMFTLELIL